MALVVHLPVLDHRPVRLLHRQPVAVGLQAPLREPLRLFLLGGERPDDVLVQSGGQGLRGDVGDEAVLVVALGELVQRVGGTAHDSPCPEAFSVDSGTTRAPLRASAASLMRSASEISPRNLCILSLSLRTECVMGQCTPTEQSAGSVAAAPLGAAARRQRGRALHRHDDLLHRDALRGAGQFVATLGPPRRLDDFPSHKLLENIHEERVGNPISFRQIAGAHPALRPGPNFLPGRPTPGARNPSYV